MYSKDMPPTTPSLPLAAASARLMRTACLLILLLLPGASCVLNGEPVSEAAGPRTGAAGQSTSQRDMDYTPVLVPDNEADALKALEEQELEFSIHGYHLALRKGREDLYRLYLQAGIDPLAEDDFSRSAGTPPIMAAVDGGNPAIVSRLLELGADVNQRLAVRNGTVIHMAASKGNAEVVRLLVEHGADIEAEDEDGWTAVFYAALSGDLETIQYLCDQGADIQRTTGEGFTPLIAGMENGQLEVARLLVELGVDIHARDSYGGSALWLSVQNQKPQILEYLISLGAEVNVRSDQIPPTLHQASAQGHVECVEILIANGADLFLLDERYGQTALHFAANRGRRRISQMLLDAGVRPEVRDSEGRTALDLAVEMRNQFFERGDPEGTGPREVPSQKDPEYMTEVDYDGTVALLESVNTTPVDESALE